MKGNRMFRDLRKSHPPKVASLSGREMRMEMRALLAGLLCGSLALACSAAALGADPKSSVPEDPKAEKVLKEGSVQGVLSSRYMGRRGFGGAEDSDLYQIVTLDFGSPGDKVRGALMGRGAFDLDGGRGLLLGPFRSIEDTFSGSPTGRLYYGYADIDDVGRFESVRVGRQYLDEMPGLAFDGLALKGRSGERTTFGLYGGIPVLRFEETSDGDWLLGFWIGRQVSSRLHLRLDLARTFDRSTPQGLGLPCPFGNGA